MKRRTIRPNGRSFTGRHVGEGTSRTVAFESALERDFLTLIRFRSDFVDVTEQPFTAKFVDSFGKSRSYTPDFQVTYRDRVVVYEVKFRRELRKNWNVYREQMIHMRSWTRENGMSYRFATDLTIRTVRFENARLLTPFLRNGIPEEMSTRIRAALADGPLSILDLRDQTTSTMAERGMFFATLWPMLAQRRLHVDLDRPLGMQSVVGAHP